MHPAPINVCGPIDTSLVISLIPTTVFPLGTKECVNNTALGAITVPSPMDILLGYLLSKITPLPMYTEKGLLNLTPLALCRIFAPIGTYHTEVAMLPSIPAII